MAVTKDSRLALRLPSDQEALIRRAAEVEGTTMTTFAVEAAVARARDVLADRRVFMLDDAAWAEFLSVLDAPVTHKPRLEKLLNSPSIFADE